MPRALLLSVVTACSGAPDKLLPMCGLACYTGPEATRHRGACHDGVFTCTESANITFCDGEVTPTKDLCDGLDNDCNGKTDELNYHPLVYQYCRRDGVCRNSNLICQDGQYVCTLPTEYEKVEHTCDNLDNDCDGIVDNIVSAEYCYLGPPATAYSAPCHPGVLVCRDGQERCENQVVPTLEVCNGVDDNCDGVIDNVDGVGGSVDMVFLIDASGSMYTTLNHLLRALDGFTGTYSNAGYRFAVVEVSGTSPSTWPFLHVVTDFTDYTTMQSLLQNDPWEMGGNEPNYDALAFACSETQLSWRPNTQGIVYLFTDEMAQSYLTPAITAADITQCCIPAGRPVFAWTDFTYRYQFEPIALDTGGRWFPLVDDWEVLRQNLGVIVEGLCTQ